MMALSCLIIRGSWGQFPFFKIFFPITSQNFNLMHILLLALLTTYCAPPQLLIISTINTTQFFGKHEGQLCSNPIGCFQIILKTQLELNRAMKKYMLAYTKKMFYMRLLCNILFTFGKRYRNWKMKQLFVRTPSSNYCEPLPQRSSYIQSRLMHF